MDWGDFPSKKVAPVKTGATWGRRNLFVTPLTSGGEG